MIMINDINAFLVRRNPDGKVEPYEVPVIGIRDKPMFIKILPTTVGSLKGLEKPDAAAETWSIADKIRYVQEHVVEPDFMALSVEEIEDQMTMWDLDALLVTAIQHGGPMRQRKEKKKGPRERSGASGKRSRR